MPDRLNVWTDRRAPGAWPNGSIVMKVHAEPEDTHADGERGEVVGSISVDDLGIAYFVVWEREPAVSGVPFEFMTVDEAPEVVRALVEAGFRFDPRPDGRTPVVCHARKLQLVALPRRHQA